ncbi:MAG: hydantoinase/oxoprolinase family protein, partial [Candidatus Binatia bacterium]|nr:hydantoinase/oxoprolinase family protein [Candidatus Binatia bacterium]
TIGAGGGSIAWIDAGGLLQVGPQSAEAVPGPVCYMKGGNEPTVTDANVALGYLNPDYLLGGEVKINGEASKAAVRLKIADPLKIGTEEAALGIFNIVNRNMTAAISQVSVERGHDPRDFVLVVAGGAGPIHAGRLAAELDIPHVIIPKIASAFCAFGETVTDVRHDFLWSYASRVKDLDLELLGRRFEEMEARGYEELSKEGFKPEEIEITRSLDMRYADQIHECTVTIPSGKITEEWVPEVEEAFHRRHEQLYTYCERDNLSEVINIGASLCGRVPRIELARLPKGTENPSKAFKGERLAYFEEQGRFVNTPIYDGERIETGNVIEGPAVIEEVTTTIVVFPKSRLVLDERGFYLLSF